MKQTAVPVEKNKTYTLSITGLTAEGAGIGRVEGFSVFVPGALLEETVEVLIIKIGSGYAIGKLLKIINASEHRVSPPCPCYAHCGGCVFQHSDYENQLVLKHRIVRDAIERIGGFSGLEILPVLPSPHAFRYRNKAAFPCENTEQGLKFGFYAQRSHTLVPVEDCLLESEKSIQVMQAVKAWAAEEKITAYSEQKHTGLLRHTVIRESDTGEIMVTLVCSGKPLKEKSLVKKLSFADSVYWNINRQDTNVIFGDSFILLHGKEQITDNILGHTFSVSPRTFLQVNHAQTERLYKIALDFLAPQKEETAADIYCGMGSITLSLAPYVKTVFGIESVPEAIDDAKRNAEANNIHNAEFYCGEAEILLPKLFHNRSCDIMIIDPPRKGCDPRVLEAILSSPCKRLVYISCGPATLARDLKILCAKGGFVIQKIQPVDMFPQTGHVETVCLLSKLSGVKIQSI